MKHNKLGVAVIINRNSNLQIYARGGATFLHTLVKQSECARNYLPFRNLHYSA